MENFIVVFHQGDIIASVRYLTGRSRSKYRGTMNKLITYAVILHLIIITVIRTTYAEAPQPELPEVKQNYSRQEVYTIAYITADKYGIDRHEFLITVDQESDFEQYAEGDNGASLGACQIHETNKIPTEKRNDPVFCLDWMAKQFIAGKSRLWTGYRLCVLDETIYHKGKKLECTANGML